jgi:hypothetical protein
MSGEASGDGGETPRDGERPATPESSLADDSSADGSPADESPADESPADESPADDPFEWVSFDGEDASDEQRSDDRAASEDETAETTPDVTVALGDVPSEPLGGWDAVPDEPDEDEPAENSTPQVALPTPPVEWRDADPTESRWWRVLTRATQLSFVVLLLWSIPLAAFDVTEQFAPESVSTTVAVAVVALSVIAGVIRFVVLPIALFRDATLLRSDERVPWSPSLVFYGIAGALFATGTCAYYLYKRGRYVGNPSPRVGGALLRYEGQSVASSWWLVVAVAAGAGTIAGGVSTVASDLALPVKLVRIAVGGPLLSLTGTSTVVDAFWSLPAPVDTAVGAPVLAVGSVTVFLRLIVLPVAFYNDATAVRRSDAEWNPLALWYALAGWVLAVPTAVVYLYRRYQYTEISLTAEGRDH